MCVEKNKKNCVPYLKNHWMFEGVCSPIELEHEDNTYSIRSSYVFHISKKKAELSTSNTSGQWSNFKTRGKSQEQRETRIGKPKDAPLIAQAYAESEFVKERAVLLIAYETIFVPELVIQSLVMSVSKATEKTKVT